MDPQLLVAMVGFLFVAAWTALGFGDALLCLIGAACSISRPRSTGWISATSQSTSSDPNAAPSVRLAERTNPLLGSVAVSTPRATILKLSSARVLLTPALSV